MNCLMTLQEHLRLFWRLRNDTKISDAEFVRCYLDIFVGGGATKFPEKIKSVGFVARAQQCHEHKMSATTNNFFFTKKQWPEKALNVILRFDCYYWS
jgi:hypothetical protein